MLPHFLPLLPILLRIQVASSQEQNVPFYSHHQDEVPLLNRVQFADYHGNNNIDSTGVDAGKIIGPLMTPFMEMFEVMQQKVKARAYMDKIERDREDSPLSSSKSLFEMIERLQRPTTTTTPAPPLLERLLRPYLEPWQKQFDDLSNDIAGISATISTSTASTTITTTFSSKNLIEKTLRLFFPSLGNDTSKITTTPLPRFFDASMIEKLLFSRTKRESGAYREKRQAILPSTTLLNPLSEFEKPILELANPFTPNPFMSLFTTKQPIPELPPIEKNKLFDSTFPTPTIFDPQFKLQDPFYNPLFPNRKSKLFDILAGGEAARILG